MCDSQRRSCPPARRSAIAASRLAGPSRPAFLFLRPRGGVVTQRTANPRTPVQFRAWPPSSPKKPRCRDAGGAPISGTLSRGFQMSESARFNMVETQIRPADVTDPQVLAAMNAVPRERFVPSAAVALAYADVPVRIAPGRYLLDPRSFAQLLQLAEIGPEDRVLDVGCGTGYSAAVLARLAAEVIALEQDADLVRVARELLANVIGKVEVVQGGLVEGVRGQAPYDVIF